MCVGGGGSDVMQARRMRRKSNGGLRKRGKMSLSLSLSSYPFFLPFSFNVIFSLSHPHHTYLNLLWMYFQLEEEGKGVWDGVVVNYYDREERDRGYRHLKKLLNLEESTSE